MLNIKKATIQTSVHKRGLSEVLAEENPILAEGEVVYEIDTGYSKLGDGENSWNELPYTNTPLEDESIDMIARMVEHMFNYMFYEEISKIDVIDCGEL